MEKGLQVIELVAENFKVLKAIEITPNKPVTVISGANGQGKSTVLDCLWAGIDAAGFTKATKTTMPIRDGEKRGFIQLSLGNGGKVELVVTRKFNPSGITVEVATAEGAVFKSPQNILDALTGAISFDPMGFSILKPADQLKQILDLVPLSIDLDKWTADRQSVFDQRTDINRQRKEKEAIYLSFPAPDPETPNEELKAETILAEQEEDRKKERANEAKRQELKDALAAYAAKKEECENIAADISECDAETAKLQARLAEIVNERATYVKESEACEKELATMKASGEALRTIVNGLEDPDMSIYVGKFADLEELNKKVRAKVAREEAKKAYLALDKESQKLTDKLEDMDKVKADAIKAAKWPVDGLGVDDNGITFNGIPYAQASSAQRLRISLAIAIALNPRLRVLRITDGSLLDSESFAIIESMCKDKGYQAFVEVVSRNKDDKMGVHIVDGEVESIR